MCDGRTWTEYTYDADAKRITLTGGDPRLHLFEAVVREHAIDLSKVSGLTIGDVRTALTSGAASIVGKDNTVTTVKPIITPIRKPGGGAK